MLEGGPWYQIYRTQEEETSFRKALASMHNVYGYAKWRVLRLLTVPSNALNDTAYCSRNYIMNSFDFRSSRSVHLD